MFVSAAYLNEEEGAVPPARPNLPSF